MNNNYNSNTVVKQDFAVMKQVDGRAAHMTETTWHQSWKSTLLPDHAGSIPVLQNVFSIHMNEDQNCIMLYSLKYLGGVSIIKLRD